MNLVIGSGDANTLLMGKDTKGFQDLIRKFVAIDKPYYNALASPIDQLRSGFILEEAYFKQLPDDFYSQIKRASKEIDVCISTLDFAILGKDEVIDFDELKTLSLTDFLEIIEPLRFAEQSEYLPIIQKTFKKYYIQVQFQLFCTDLNSANLVFLAVETYNDQENYAREITERDYIKFRVFRDEQVISQLKERANFFQGIKNYLNS
jgi:hypothetical protein